MGLRDKFGHFGILWFLNRSFYDEQPHFCLTKIFKLLEKILELNFGRLDVNFTTNVA